METPDEHAQYQRWKDMLDRGYALPRPGVGPIAASGEFTSVPRWVVLRYVKETLEEAVGGLPRPPWERGGPPAV